MHPWFDLDLDLKPGLKVKTETIIKLAVQKAKSIVKSGDNERYEEVFDVVKFMIKNKLVCRDLIKSEFWNLLDFLLSRNHHGVLSFFKNEVYPLCKSQLIEPNWEVESKFLLRDQELFALELSEEVLSRLDQKGEVSEEVGQEPQFKKSKFGASSHILWLISKSSDLLDLFIKVV